jgi:hypothetical protein
VLFASGILFWYTEATMTSIDQSIAAFVSSNPWIIVIILWSLVWKLIALWKSARSGQLTWFIVLAVVNTVGILEICYLIWMHFREKKETGSEQQ